MVARAGGGASTVRAAGALVTPEADDCDVHHPGRYPRGNPAVKHRDGITIRTIIGRNPVERNSGHRMVVLVQSLSKKSLLFTHMNRSGSGGQADPRQHWVC